jgi:hypothetical protein
MRDILESVARSFGVLAPPLFLITLAGILFAQHALALRRRRHTKHVERLIDDFKAKQRETARQLEELLKEYESDLESIGDLRQKRALDNAYHHYQKRQKSAILQLDTIKMDVSRFSDRAGEPELETVAHQVLDYFGNQQAVK